MNVKTIVIIQIETQINETFTASIYSEGHSSLAVMEDDSDDEKKVFEEENVDVLSQAQAKEAGVGVGNQRDEARKRLTCHYNSQWLFCHNLPLFSHHYPTSSF